MVASQEILKPGWWTGWCFHLVFSAVNYATAQLARAEFQGQALREPGGSSLLASPQSSGGFHTPKLLPAALRATRILLFVFLIHLKVPAVNWQSSGWGDGQAGSGRDVGIVSSQRMKMSLYQQLSKELPRISSPRFAVSKSGHPNPSLAVPAPPLWDVPPAAGDAAASGWSFERPQPKFLPRALLWVVPRGTALPGPQSRWDYGQSFDPAGTEASRGRKSRADPCRLPEQHRKGMNN